MSNCLMRSLSLSMVVLISCPGVLGQEKDPFADRDPFSRRLQGEQPGRPVMLKFKVRNQDGSPLAGVRMRGPGIYRPVFTNREGTATWETDTSKLRRWASKTNGKLRFFAVPPANAVMPSVSKRISLEDSLTGKTIEFTTQPGVRLTGRVIGQRDRKPIQGVNVAAYTLNRSARRVLLTDTDEHGRWSGVVPRVELKVTVSGHREGYKLNGVANSLSDDFRIVEVSTEDVEIPLEDFEIEQLEPLRVLVSDASGDPVPEATVGVYRQRWLDPQIAIWELISNHEKTGPQGSCSVFLQEVNAESAVVFATATMDDSIISGRTRIPSVNQGAITVIVQSSGKIAGTLQNDGKPASNIEVVLYEAIQKSDGSWTTMGLRDTAKTDQQGRYVFNAPRGLRYIVALQARNAQGVQPTIHRTERPIMNQTVVIPEVDLTTLLNR